MNADSVKARLKNYAVSSGHTFQEVLVYYGLERTIYRISVSPYADRFVLKGGIFPVILDMNAPIVNAYSLESSIAEKLEAIIKNGFLNSRYKDFYDIYMLSQKHSFNYEELHNAVIDTFTNRKTPMTLDIAAFSDEFLNDAMHKTRWNSFLKKKKALIPISLSDAVIRIRTFVQPILNGSDNPYTEWDPDEGCWKE